MGLHVVFTRPPPYVPTDSFLNIRERYRLPSDLSRDKRHAASPHDRHAASPHDQEEQGVDHQSQHAYVLGNIY